MRNAQPVLLVLGLAAIIAAAWPAHAELQNVTVGGQIQIRGYYWHNAFNGGRATGMALPAQRWPARALQGRPMGAFLGIQGAWSYYDWDSRGPDYKLVSQRTRLNVTADFTEHVSAFIELESFDVWGEDFRSDYVTGLDARANSADDVEIYQSYIEVDEMFDLPLRARIGRQEIVLGSGWLVGANANRPEFSGLSFDALRLTHAADAYTLEALYAKLVERSPLEEDGDVDLFGVYASCTAVEDITFDAYWLFVRDARAVSNTALGPVGEYVEDVFHLDDYPDTHLHTVGLRAAGQLDGFDFELEGAYQFGDAARVGALFAPNGYGDTDAQFANWAAHAEAGYTFDVAWQPRIYIGGAYFQGQDDRDISFWERLNPYAARHASISFNRLFSDACYSLFLDEMGEMSNFWTVRGGISASPTEQIELGMDVAYLAAVDPFDAPLHVRFGRFRVPVLPAFPFSTIQSEHKLGIEYGVWARYRYTDDLVFEAGYSHLFVLGGLTGGSFSDLNGLMYNGGTGKEDANYFYLGAELAF